MNSRRSRVITLAQHEYRSAVRSNVFFGLTAILVVVSAVSVYISSVDYSSQLADYQAYLAAATAGGLAQTAPSPLQPLALMRGALEYIEIIGAVIAIVLGYLSVTRERTNRTLQLIGSRPVTGPELATGNALGALAVISAMMAVTAVTSVLCIGVIGHDWIGAADAVKLALAFTAAVIYMEIFYCLGAICTARSSTAANGLIAALVIWLVVVLILPQLGDTLDADNQVPGGLFSALGLGRPDETEILKHFSLYEHIRTGFEEASLTKHFERFSFAMTDVPVKYRGFSLCQLFIEKRNDVGWLLSYPVLLGWMFIRTTRKSLTNSQEHVS